MSVRNERKDTLFTKCKEIMDGSELFCDDDTHLLGCVMAKEKFGVYVEPHIVKFIVSVDRARRKVLAENPEIDLRVKTKELAEEDRKYYAN